MDKGAIMLVRVVLAALLLGALVIVFHPDYRAAARSWKAGTWPTSAIWESNANYYSEVLYDEVKGADSDAE